MQDNSQCNKFNRCKVIFYNTGLKIRIKKKMNNNNKNMMMKMKLIMKNQNKKTDD